MKFRAKNKAKGLDVPRAILDKQQVRSFPSSVFLYCSISSDTV